MLLYLGLDITDDALEESTTTWDERTAYMQQRMHSKSEKRFNCSVKRHSQYAQKRAML